MVKHKYDLGMLKWGFSITEGNMGTKTPKVGCDGENVGPRVRVKNP